MPTETRHVSIVIPCHDGARFLKEAIESALSQSYRAVEVVVVDDGSEDGSAGVAAGFTEVVLVQQPHRGLSAARNAGLARSTGSYVLFLDADDRLAAGAVEHAARLLSDDPSCAFVAGGHLRMDDEGRRLSGPDAPPPGSDLYERMLRRCYLAMGAVLFRRGALASDPFDTRLDAAEDYDLYLRLAASRNVSEVSEVFLEYRIHPGSLTSSRPEAMLKQTLAVLRRQRTFAATSPRYRRAYEDGVRFWRTFYGRQLGRAIMDDMGRGHWMRALRRSGMLVRYWPGAVGYAPGAVGRRIARMDRSDGGLR